MCGIVGVWDRERSAEQPSVARAMLSTLVHRGPDGCGLVSYDGCSLGLQRLAIIDPSAPAEPFSNEEGTVFCVCNGQIYNSAELAAGLEHRGHVLRTRVDTEVIPHLWEEHGTALLERLNGMFAFALWDARRRTLFLARDRAGEKPLYYWHGHGRLLFGSELRALLEHPEVSAVVDPVALVHYLAQGYVPAPRSIVQDIRKLPAGHYLLARGEEVEVHRYWDLADWFPEEGSGDSRSRDAIAEELDGLLSEAVRRRSRSDVPFGVFLSGGIDSSAVLAYLTRIHGPGVPAFSIGHGDSSFDESDYAGQTAQFFGADFRKLVLGEADLAEGLRLVTGGMDEPLGDASTIPTHLLSLFARRHVKVVLSGEGADELFGGYPTYLGSRIADRLHRIPPRVRHALLAAIRKPLPVSMGNVGLDYLLQCLESGLDRERLERHNVWFGSTAPERLREVLAPAVLDLAGPSAIAAAYAGARPERALSDDLSQLLYTDFVRYLQDDLLTKVDRATMLASLESRAPYLDHELAQFAAGVPSRHKVRGLTTKLILRRAVGRHLPRAVLRRRKRGFNIPFSRWVLHGLGDRLRERFAPERVAARGLFRHEGLAALLDEHMARRADHRKPLYALLALDLWCDRTFGEGAAVACGETGPETGLSVSPSAGAP